ncbi:uncharacterized protein A4U43_C04F20680 [Asparagus officinalis]|uniref:X8 domain-containing protein n=1 Tax=Asparagus officinalis TaxID=4686 RepID=A0A5P1F759_ASPOF|nr:probable glucan endo-1,3-beta-glucosidase A6 [Asparagus officinalis]ONK72559.1 uncharacterized protein A4U43_C04F20680 [Asparagus officinalis]
MVPNDRIPSLASNESAADAWISTFLLPFYPKTRVRFLLVGNEVLSDRTNKGAWFDLVPAMINIYKSLKKHKIDDIKVGTSMAMDTLSATTPPSSGEFRPDIAEPVMKPMLKFLNDTGSYFFLDAYTYFPWSYNHTKISLDYALFEANSSLYYTDPLSKLTYTNLFDEMLDSVIFAMKRVGYGSIRLCVAETGWPNAGDIDEIGANIHNAAIYNRNLAKRFRMRPGTPLRPGSYMPIFVFALYNENIKPGPGTERHWGVLYPNGTRVYDVDLTGERTEFAPLPLPTNNEPYKGKIWCVLRADAKNETAVGAALSYACGQGNGTCDAIQKGRECYEPNNLFAHANYAINSYWLKFRDPQNWAATCYFGGLAEQATVDPSYGSCKYPSLNG